MTGKLDAHMHVWRMSRGDYDWLIPDLGPLWRDFAIDDAWPEARQAGVSQVILVQAAATAAETDFMLSISEADERVAGVVGWIDFEAAHALDEVERMAASHHIVGLRPMIADLPDPEWILRGEFSPVLTAMAQHGLVFDGHARHDLVPVMTELAGRHPDLRIVLNHGGKPQIADHRLDPWRNEIAVLAQHPNVSCKLSGLLTEAGVRSDDASIGEVVGHLGECFGPERLLWGSDWPVLTLAASYKVWAEQSDRLIGRYFADHADAIWRGNAERIYLGKGEA